MEWLSSQIKNFNTSITYLCYKSSLNTNYSLVTAFKQQVSLLVRAIKLFDAYKNAMLRIQFTVGTLTIDATIHWDCLTDQSAFTNSCLADYLTKQSSWLVSLFTYSWVWFLIKKCFKTKYFGKSQFQILSWIFCIATLWNITFLLFLSKRKQRNFKETFKLCTFKENPEHFDRDLRRTTYWLHAGEFHPGCL